MSINFLKAGCVHFQQPCEIKILILLYTSEKKAFLGFIPNNQAAFVDRLRKVIMQNKSMQQGANPNPQVGGNLNIPQNSGINPQVVPQLKLENPMPPQQNDQQQFNFQMQQNQIQDNLQMQQEQYKMSLMQQNRGIGNMGNNPINPVSLLFNISFQRYFYNSFYNIFSRFRMCLIKDLIRECQDRLFIQII